MRDSLQVRLRITFALCRRSSIILWRRSSACAALNPPANFGVKLSAGWCPARRLQYCHLAASRRPQIAPAEILVSRGGRRAAFFLAREARRSLQGLGTSISQTHVSTAPAYRGRAVRARKAMRPVALCLAKPCIRCHGEFMNSFIISLWVRVLVALRWLSPLEWLWLIAPRTRSHGWIDLWVLANLCASIVVLLLAVNHNASILVIVLIIYGALRLVEVVVYQLRLMLLGQGGALTGKHAVRSYRRMVVLALHNYLEAIVWFAGFYSVLRDGFGAATTVLATPIGALYFSSVTMTTLGYGDITPKDPLSRIVVSLHLGVAVFMTLIILARFVSFLPTPRTLDDSERPIGQ